MNIDNPSFNDNPNPRKRRLAQDDSEYQERLLRLNKELLIRLDKHLASLDRVILLVKDSQQLQEEAEAEARRFKKECRQKNKELTALRQANLDLQKECGQKDEEMATLRQDNLDLQKECRQKDEEIDALHEANLDWETGVQEMSKHLSLAVKKGKEVSSKHKGH